MNSIINNLFFGIIISLIAFEIGLYINRKTKLSILNPFLIATALIILFLLAFNIDYETYNNGAQFINMFLGPSTVVLAVPLYKQRELLKKNATAIILGIILGSLMSMISVAILSYIFNLDISLLISLLPKSITTPIGIEVSNELGGIVPVTILAIAVSGVTGAILAPSVCKIFEIDNKVAKGIAIGTSSHALGTTKALEMGETEGAMSSLSIGVAGIVTVFIAPIMLKLINLLLF